MQPPGTTDLTDPVHQSENAAKLVADEALKNLKELIGDDIHRMIEFHDGFWDRASNIVSSCRFRGTNDHRRHHTRPIHRPSLAPRRCRAGLVK
jgi:hypothetical protein